ncbi:type II toxin-antitoxin system Phd/YefM family antitoxin [Candidatus Roizmanbacteria bacterium]|nr:type II toxin-antitoxin system Phd/YefM family antitoxin [Candidatus Roizmanbacteria bacterium]
MKQVNVRELQHNLTKYLELSKAHPVLVTKYGRNEVLLINPEEYEVIEKLKKKKDIMSSQFIGMYKNRKDWKNKSSQKIARNLREKAWYGEKENTH